MEIDSVISASIARSAMLGSSESVILVVAVTVLRLPTLSLGAVTVKPPKTLLNKWWITSRDDNPVRAALSRASLKWVPETQKKLDENKLRGSHPNSWVELATELDRDPANIWQERKGNHALSRADVFAFCHLLELDVTLFFPPDEDVVTTATLELCDGHITSDEARAYVIYCFSCSRPHREELDAHALEDVVLSMKGKFQDVRVALNTVLRVANELDRKLAY